jgi:cytochrome c oxidase assembly protein subunit 15
MSRDMVVPMILLFVLGGMQGAIGWIMVQSGLVPEMYFVGHIELTTHLIAAMAVLVFTFWFALKLSVNKTAVVHDSRVWKYLTALLCLIIVQMIYGGFMAGLKAAQSAPTWPDINGHWVPNLQEQNLYVQFIHRGLGYLIFVMNVVLFFKTAHLAQYSLYRKLRLALVGLINIQVILGILSLVFATNKNSFLMLGVLHQFNALLVLLTLVWMLYVVRKAK